MAKRSGFSQDSRSLEQYLVSCQSIEIFLILNNFLFSFAVFFVVPETKGKSLNEIQKMLAGEKETIENTEEDKN